MPLTVLSDPDIRDLLHALSRDEVLALQANLAEALHDYSTGTTESTPCCSANQPQRIAIAGPDGQTTLFMPARSGDATGIKVVSVRAPKCAPSSSSSSADLPADLPADLAALRVSSTSSSSSTRQEPSLKSSASSVAPSSVDSAADTASSRSSISTTQTTATTSSSSSTPSSSSSSAAVPPPSDTWSTTTTTTPQHLPPRSSSPTGTLTLLSPTGQPTAFLAATTLTAFRTALASTLLFMKRSRVHTLLVFGAGAQAYWHIRLALLLRGPEMHHVHVINRSFAGAQPLMQHIYQSPRWAALRTSNAKLRFSVLSADFGEYARLLKERVREADVIFCCTPATAPLFPAPHLTAAEGRKKGRYVSLIGSYRPHMLEVHPSVLQQAVHPQQHDHRHHHHKQAASNGVIVVDSLEACLKEAGEVIQAGLSGEQMVEVGELVAVKKAVLREVEMGGEGEKGLRRWLEAGQVVYKSVGLGLMDVQVGGDLVAIARRKGVGTLVEGF